MAPANAVLESTVNGPAESVDAGPQHVLDLPQLYSKPSPHSLLAAISLLAVDPPSWTGDAKPSAISEDGIPSYLTRIISSPLAWINSDTEKEVIWEAASKRLAERSGRTALPSVSRTFSIPVDSQSSSSTGSTIEIKLHEPSLTGDNLGHKTWVASYLLAKRLPDLLPRHFPSIIRSSQTPAPTSPDPQDPSPDSDPDPIPQRPHILELGAGTGLVGIAAAALFQTTTHLTDLPDILPNLTHNIANNAHLTSSSTVTAAPLDWSDFDSADSNSLSNNNNNTNTETHPSQTFDLILASDSLYAPDHPKWLTAVIGAFLRKPDKQKHESSRVVIMLPYRSVEEAPCQRSVETEKPHEELKERMLERGFVVVEEGEDEGWDDWVDARVEGGRVVVRCWWCVWRWG